MTRILFAGLAALLFSGTASAYCIKGSAGNPWYFRCDGSSSDIGPYDSAYAANDAAIATCGADGFVLWEDEVIEVHIEDGKVEACVVEDFDVDDYVARFKKSAR